MDSVYGTKKYFQNLSGGSDIYTRSSNARAMMNDYSYQNTLGRRSAIGPYSHMNKYPSYSTDLSSQYGYNSWGIWRDPRNIAPSTYSSKSSRQSSVRSFSIILTTAAFIVILAVLSIAGLAFYFSTFKSNIEDSVMAFEGSFRISKGDIYTTGLKYNHTSTYKQKVDFYKRFVERSLLDSGLLATRTDITGFGDGPIIHTHFRVFIDMQHVPQTISSMEEYIMDAFLKEIAHPKSLYKSLHIEKGSAEVKRILDQDVLKSASFAKTEIPAASQTHFEDRLLNKKPAHIEKSGSKLITTKIPKLKPQLKDDEPEVDVENAPVIQGSYVEGSFEITKTDADITQRKTSPTKSVTTTKTEAVKSTADPTIRFKTQKTTIEKVGPFQKHSEKMSTFMTSSPKIETTPLSDFSSPAQKSTTTTTSTTSSKTTTTSEIPTTHIPSTSTQSESESVHEKSEVSEIHNPPKLDANLFTVAPILDMEPWRPIRPTSEPNPPELPHLHAPAIQKGAFNGFSQPEVDSIETGLLPRHKMTFSNLATENPNEIIFYHSFTNPVFMPETSGIEKLGNSDVKPHPLPVPLLEDVVIPEFKPLMPLGIDTLDEHTDIFLNKNFEHIGGGVIIKQKQEEPVLADKIVEDIENQTLNDTTNEKQEIADLSEEKISETLPPFPAENNSFQNVDTEVQDETEITANSNQEISTEISKIDELLLDLLEVRKITNDSSENEDDDLQIESRIETGEPEISEKPNFLNFREHILSLNKTQESTVAPNEKRSTLNRTPSTSTDTTTTTTTTETTTTETTTTRRITSSTKRPKRKPSKTTRKPTTISGANSETRRTTPVTIDDSMLFPSHTKWEYVNGSAPIEFSSPNSALTKKVFNETLHAWIVENLEKPGNSTTRETETPKSKSNHTENIHDIAFIFDTLASRLGITPDASTKTPPFNKFSQNKFRQNTRNGLATTTAKAVTKLQITSTPISSTPKSTSDTTTTDSWKPFISSLPSSVPLADASSSLPILLMDPNSEEPSIVVGEAEVEVVDPTKYEEMLSSSQGTTSSTTAKSMPLVTLLPVRSNSGIKRFRPLPSTKSEGRRFGADQQINSQFREAVVKTGIQVTV